MSGLYALASLQLHYGWLFLIFALATAWLMWQWLRGRVWAQTALKLMLVLYAGLAGWLYFSGVLSPGCAWQNVKSFFWPQMMSRTLAFLWFVAGLLWMLDAFLGRTALALPVSPVARMAFLAGLICALCFPVYELVGGRFYPQAQMFGAGPAPLVLFSVCLLGGSRPASWIGRLLLFFNVCLSLDTGLAAAICSQRWHYLPVFLAAAAALTYALAHPRMVTLNKPR